MQLKITRSQREGGVIATSVIFCLDARAELTAEERSNVLRYRLGNQTLYSSESAKRHADKAAASLDQTERGTHAQQWGGIAKGLAYAALSKLSLNISVDSLQRGHHIECKDLNEVIATESALFSACENLREYLATAATFDGREAVIDFSKEVPQVVAPDPAAVVSAPAFPPTSPDALPAPERTAPSYDMPVPAAEPTFGHSSAALSGNPFEGFAEKFKYWWAYRTSGQRIFFVIACVVLLYLIVKAL
jgi:hypothetical protein